MSDSEQQSKKLSSKKKAARTGKRKGRKQSSEAKLNVSLRKHIRKLRRELEAKDEVLQLYADHRNWVRPDQIKERLNIPEADRSGKKIEDPTQCFVGARYPWEPALKILMGMAEQSAETEEI